MASVRPFDFPQQFEALDGGLQPREELEAEVARLRAEVGRAREEGRAEGFADALVQLEAERETAMLAASGALTSALLHLDQRFDAIEQQVARLGAELALDLADHLAARALERDPALGIEQAIVRALSQVRRGQPLQIRVAPECVEAVQRCLDHLQTGERRRLSATVLPQADVPPGDVRIHWDDGAMLLDREARRQAMATEIAAMLAAA
mgnify:FL=1